MSDDQWYVRKSGKVTGPYTRAQLEGLRKRGQLSHFHEVTQNRTEWQSAAAVIGQIRGPGSSDPAGPVSGDVFAVQGGPAESPTGGTPPSPPSQVWFYNDAVSSPGPVSSDQLDTLLRSGRITAETQVWREGYPTWVSLRDVPELAGVSLAGPSAAPGIAGINLAGQTPVRTPFGHQANRMVVAIGAASLVALIAIGAVLVFRNGDGFRFNSFVQPSYINSHTRNDIPKAVGLVVSGASVTDLKKGTIRELPASRGSCFAVSPDGYILTNKHVIKDHDDLTRAVATLKEIEDKYTCKVKPKLWVFFGREEKYEAKVEYISGKYDLAVLKVNWNRSGPYFRLHGASEIRQAIDVFALGFPVAVSQPLNLTPGVGDSVRKLSENVETTLTDSDFRYTITKGIISLTRIEDGTEYIMHGAQISGGNSGGPLIDENGIVLGVNTLRTGTIEGEEGKGLLVNNYYAVSISPAVDELEKHLPRLTLDR